MNKRILLVEPGYKNKYPPLGLMKLSTYHKHRGDSVTFVKGLDTERLSQIWDRVYITTLFTFDFDIDVKTINAYKYSVKSVHQVFVGGILATLMPDRLSKAVGLPRTQICTGQLTDSRKIRYRDQINIDNLALDYDILETIPYEYPAGNNYFGYITRGCPNRCSFCAVPVLEPCFEVSNNIKKQISAIDQKYGKKQKLLLLDNNILNAPSLETIVDDLCELGFYKGAEVEKQSEIQILMKRYKNGDRSEYLNNRIVPLLQKFRYRIRDRKQLKEYLFFLSNLEKSDDIPAYILANENLVCNLVSKYYTPVRQKRTIDFNQGLDARLITDSTMVQLARLSIDPLRIAFDSIELTATYVRAVKLACKYGMKKISNYLLFNYHDKPQDLYQRIKINISLNRELGIQIFSFPMRYSPIDQTTRDYVGKFWNHKYLLAISAILNATKGIVAAGEQFFYRAFGRTEDEFMELLMMPREMIMFRTLYEEKGLSAGWKEDYSALSEEERQELVNILCFTNRQILENGWPMKFNKIMRYYFIRHEELQSF